MGDFNSYNDEQLVELVRNEDQELYREIVKRYQEKIWRYVFYILRDEAKSSDVSQNTFIKAFVNLKGFDNRRKFSSWLYRIAHNEAINEFKKHKKELSFNDVAEPFYDSGFMAEFDAIKDRELINHCLQKMPIKYREILILFYLEEKSYTEISEILQAPAGTVAARISRAKKIMKEICQRKK